MAIMQQRQGPDNWQLFQQLLRLLAGGWVHGRGDTLDGPALERLTHLAMQHRVAAALACRVADRLPPEQLQHSGLQATLLENTRRNLLMTSQCLRLAGTLNRAGIRPLFFKGAAALLSLPNACSWERPAGFREQIDIDVLIPSGELPAACRALLDVGYRFQAPSQGPAPATPQEALHRSRFHRHLPPLVLPGYAAPVELHRAPLAPRFHGAAEPGDWLHRALPARRQGADFLLPCPEHAILAAVLGRFVGDGFLASADLCPRAVCDYLSLRPAAAGELDRDLLRRHGGEALALFEALAGALTGLSFEALLPPAGISGARLKLMRARYNSTLVGAALDRQARWRHLALALRHSGGKLPDYLRRRLRHPGAAPAGNGTVRR